MIRINLIRRPPVNLDRFRKPPAPPLLTLNEALQQSNVYRAARPYGGQFYVVSDGGRFWTSFRNFAGMYVTEYAPDFVKERSDKLWRPVIGNEQGWRLV